MVKQGKETSNMLRLDEINCSWCFTFHIPVLTVKLNNLQNKLNVFCSFLYIDLFYSSKQYFAVVLEKRIGISCANETGLTLDIKPVTKLSYWTGNGDCHINLGPRMLICYTAPTNWDFRFRLWRRDSYKFVYVLWTHAIWLYILNVSY